MTVDELTQEQMQAYIHKAERVRKALEGAVEALKAFKTVKYSTGYTQRGAEVLANKAIAAGEEALK